VAPDVIGLLLAAAQQPESDIPQSPISESDALLFAGFVLVVGAIFAFDMVRTWWETNAWKREARRRRREQR
jgi:hypothetical protein